MTISNIQQPVRRSRRGTGVPLILQPSAATSTNATTDEPVYVRPTDLGRDLELHQYEELQAEEDNAVESVGHSGTGRSLETRFYESFRKTNESSGVGAGPSEIKRPKYVYGKQKRKATGQEEEERAFRVGDTVLVDTASRKPSVGVLVAICKVFDIDASEGEDEQSAAARWTNLRVRWFSRVSDLPQHRLQRETLKVRSGRLDASLS